MQAAQALEQLASSNHRLSDALRSALLVPEVAAVPTLTERITHELNGYQDGVELPSYRIRKIPITGNANNGAWAYASVRVPVETLTGSLRDYANQPCRLVQGVGSLESLLAIDASEFAIPWKASAMGHLNRQIAAGTTSIEPSYFFTDAQWTVSRAEVQGLLESVRHQAMVELARLVPPEDLAARIEGEQPVSPQGVSVVGSGNQIIVASPGATASLIITPGDIDSLRMKLASLGIDADMVGELEEILDDPEDDEAGRLLRAMRWCKRAAMSVGVNTVGSGAATLILHYLGFAGA